MTLSVQVVALITAIGGLIVPPVTSLLKKESWSPRVKQAIAMVLSLGVSAASIAIVQPNYYGLSFVSLGGLVYAGGQLVYGHLFKGSEVETKLAAIGSKKAPPA